MDNSPIEEKNDLSYTAKNTPPRNQQPREPIAITGIGCRFPGGVNSAETFWQLLGDGSSAISEIPPDRIDLERYYDPRPATPGKIMTRWGGFLDQIDLFDAHFFGIAPREAERLDPQQRLLLEVAWEALADAGQVNEQLAGSPTGVFVGLWLNDFEGRLFADPSVTDFYMTTGSGRYSASGRLSYFFGFQGPSLTIDTACSSSLVAVHLACQSLWRGESKVALAGGANVILQPHISIAYSQSKMMAADGRCKFGDARADGYVRSEGAAIIVLKPLADALAAGDPVYAVIRGSAVNNDGRSSGYLATPARLGQELLLRQAYGDAGISPGQVQYVEAHGTGTRAGDPVEIGALGMVLAEARPANQPCYIGSVKSNFGHTEGAAGVAGLIKVALALKHRAIPASLHFETPNPNIPWDELPVTIPRRLMPWPDYGQTAVAGVSSFGIAGTNAHVVLAANGEQLTVNSEQLTVQNSQFLLPLSAHTAEALQVRAQAFREFLLAADAPPLADLCYTAAVRRSHFDQRLAVTGRSHEELAQQLQAFLAGDPQPGLVTGQAAPGPHKVVFVFPGQGSQWLGMGRELSAKEPVFQETLAECEAAMRLFVDWSLSEQLTAEPDDSHYRLDQIDVIQPTLLAIEIGLARLWRSWGVEPDAVIGHSMGEVAAAYVAGALSLSDAMRVICQRSRLLRRTSGQGAMAVVGLPLSQAQEALAGLEDRLSIAVSNSPRSTVISGEPAALETLLAELEAQEIFCRPIKVDVASHSPQMDPLRPDLLRLLAELEPRAAAIPIYATATGEISDGAAFDAAYWAKNLRQPVLFATMVQRLLADGHTIFIEMSPHPILLPAVEETCRHVDRQGYTVSSLRRGQPEQLTMWQALGQLYTLGYTLNWPSLYPAGGQVVSLPAYPWQRERFWFEPEAAAIGSVGERRPGAHPLLARYLPSASGAHIWETELSLAHFPYLRDHQVRGTAVFPAAAYAEMVLAAASEAFGDGTLLLEKVSFQEAIFLTDKQPYLVQLLLTPDMPGRYAFQFFGRPAGSDPSAWTLHSSGLIGLKRKKEEGRKKKEEKTPSAFRPLPSAFLPGADHYRAMQQRGLTYGPAFQAITRWRCHDGIAQAELQLSPTITEAHTYQVHPTLLDGCFQLLVAASAEAGESSSATDTLLPTRLDSLQLHRRPEVAETLVGYVERQTDDEGLVGDLYLLDGQEQPVLTAKGLRLERLTAGQQQFDDWLYEIEWQPQPDPAAALPEQPGAWFIFADESGLGEALAARLETQGETAVLISAGSGELSGQAGRYQLDPTRAADFQKLLSVAGPAERPLRGIVHLWSLDTGLLPESTTADLEAAQERGSLSVLHLVQALGQIEPADWPRLWLVTRHSQAVGRAENAFLNAAQAPLWGLGRVISHEHPQLRSTCLDLDLSPASAEIEAVWAELWSDKFEDQIALRAETRYVARLIRYSENRQRAHRPQRPFTPAPGEGYRLAIPTPGILDNLALQAAPRRQPGPDEVEIEVAAAGLNFLDVMKALGIYPGLDPNAPVALGAECAGRITAVGIDVTGFKPGDEVIAVSPSLNNTGLLTAYATLPAELVVAKPASLSLAEAATIPINFLTAHYALNHLGRLAAGERVLIHSAAGGVGLAAVQLCQLAGAEIFATAGSPEKRAYLRQLGIEHVMDSRSLDFAAEIMAQTAGQGVDLVLNSLAGEALRQSLALLAPYGRFLEIGKRDIYQNSPLGLAPFQKNLSFFAIDLARVIAERPALIGSLLRDLVQQVAAGTLHPLPATLFPLDEATQAFHIMAQGHHKGKIVLTTKAAGSRQQAEGPSSLLPLPSAVTIHPQATYLITGGLGSLGLLTAEWLAQQGARHILLVGRSEPAEAAQQRINGLEQAGVQVKMARADVAQAEQIGTVLARIEPDMPPLRGVIHAAGLLADSTLLQMDRAQLFATLAPKVYGGWHLHTLTQALPLDFFVLFSSAAALLGLPGQANYAAANAFLDALAHHRQRAGLPALSLNWGPWADVGLAAAQANRGARLAERGLDSISPQAGIAVLARFIRQPAAQVAVMNFAAARWCQSYPAASDTSLLRSLLAEQEVEQAVSAPQVEADLRAQLLALEPGRPRRTYLEAHLQQQVAQVLRLALHRVEVQKPVKQLGLDSLMAVELRNRLESSLGVTLSATLVFNYPTITAMTPYLAQKMGISLDGVAAPEAESAAQANDRQPVDMVTSVKQLSDAEAEALLLKELEEINL